MITKKIVLNFPINRAAKPIAYHLVKDYNLVVNILQADIASSNETGSMITELQGTKQDVLDGIEFLKGQDIRVEELSHAIRFDSEVCVHCGACVGGCPVDSLRIDRQDQWRVSFDEASCIACEFCVPVCPVDALSLEVLKS
jgi:L-aspartate semialdehyde sulfurtransferase ferredoxin